MSETKRMPAIFIGHGSPENAFEETEWSEAWQRIATRFPKPEAILVISAHWTNRISDDAITTSVTTSPHPETIHDFYGFPKRFYNFSYPAPGDPALAETVRSLIRTVDVRSDAERGLDHGAWSVLSRMYPEADIPVIQLSIDEDLPCKDLFEIGTELSGLRDRGVLILGSGNIVHNLRTIVWDGDPYPWATGFDDFVRDALVAKDYQVLINFEKHPHAHVAHPTVDHFLPLLFVIGASQGEDPTFFCEQIFAASLSMRCVVYGLDNEKKTGR